MFGSAAAGHRRGFSSAASWGPALNSALSYYLGHSLENFDIPQMVYGLALDAGLTHTYVAKIGNGANLQFQYTNPTSGQVWPEDEEISPLLWLPANPRDVVFITEAVPVEDQISGASSLDYALDFFELAVDGNPDVQVYLYQHWHYLNDERGNPPDYTAWDTKLGTDLAYWQQIATYVNANRTPGTRPMLIHPGGQLMRAFYAAGDVEGLTIGDLFVDPVDDSIHQNNLGNYYQALGQYTTTFRRSPVGLTNALENRFETMYDPMPTLAQAAAMQELVLGVVRPWLMNGGLG